MEYKGKGAAKGIGLGEIYIYAPFAVKAEERSLLPEETAQAAARYEKALLTAQKELEAIHDLSVQSNAEQAKIFLAHIDILQDVVMNEEIFDCILEKNMDADWAVEKTYNQYMDVLGAAKDPLIKERAADMKDVKNRLLRCLAGVPESNLACLEKPVIIVTRDLLPSDTVTLDREKVLAIVTEVGCETSHSAIIARSYGIPALLGIPGITRSVSAGEFVIVDADEGVLITDPASEQVKSYTRKREVNLQIAADVKKYLDAQAVTTDGTAIKIAVNLGTADNNELACARHVDAVGLLRTEFLYMGKAQPPTEEEQYTIYKKILETFRERYVTLRTLDIGGDKKLECLKLPEEENPFLGNRALRLCFSNEELFLTQLRAALRASVHGNLQIMFPMVGSLDDLRRAKELLARASAQLDAQGIPWDKNTKLGVMIEIPALAIIADLVVKEVDFASIGTNDLIQYLLAADRGNPDVAPFYQPYHPAVLRLLQYVIRQFNAAGKPISVCGELGGDPLAAAALIGMGMRTLSMGFSSVAIIKKMVCDLSLTQAQLLADLACRQDTAEDAEKVLRSAVEPLLGGKFV